MSRLAAYEVDLGDGAELSGFGFNCRLNRYCECGRTTSVSSRDSPSYGAAL